VQLSSPWPAVDLAGSPKHLLAVDECPGADILITFNDAIKMRSGEPLRG
jgi:hypothetical protein